MKMTMWRMPLLLAAVGMLGACSSLAPRQSLPKETMSTTATAAEEARLAVLDAQPDWTFQGRVAISKGRSGGNGRIDWQQQGDGYRISLSAPVTRQSWQLSGGTDRPVRLEGLEGGPRSGDDAGDVLQQATGWQIPVEQLPRWVRGQPAAGAQAPDYMGYDAATGLPRMLRQQGWRIDYLDWYPADAERPALPRRIEAVNGDAKVRLIVDEWSAEGR